MRSIGSCGVAYIVAGDGLKSDRESVGGEVWKPRPRSRLPGVVIGFVSCVNPLLEPVEDFLLNPSDSRLAEAYPFGELPCRFEACDVLVGVQYQLLEMTL